MRRRPFWYGVGLSLVALGTMLACVVWYDFPDNGGGPEFEAQREFAPTAAEQTKSPAPNPKSDVYRAVEAFVFHSSMDYDSPDGWVATAASARIPEYVTGVADRLTTDRQLVLLVQELGERQPPTDLHDLENNHVTILLSRSEFLARAKGSRTPETQFVKLVFSAAGKSSHSQCTINFLTVIADSDGGTSTRWGEMYYTFRLRVDGAGQSRLAYQYAAMP